MGRTQPAASSSFDLRFSSLVAWGGKCSSAAFSKRCGKMPSWTEATNRPLECGSLVATIGTHRSDKPDKKRQTLAT
jgi:hypothetical protein